MMNGKMNTRKKQGEIMSNFKMTSHKDEVLDELDSKVEIALEKIGLRAETHAKKYCPVDTGRLRNSISHTQSGDTEYIGTNVEYAPYVEFGTSTQKAQPYLKPAVTNHVEEYKKIVKSTLKEG